MAHTFDVSNAAVLDDVSRYRFLSREELVAAIDPDPDDAVLDVGSGTGFYTTDVAPHVDPLYAVDVQPGMHERFREHGLPGDVRPVTAAAATLPFPDGSLDAAFSTMTFHEFCTPEGLAEIARTLAPGAPFVNADWSAAGAGEAGPPRSERQDAAGATDRLQAAGFRVRRATERPETFVVVAHAE